MNGSKFLLTFNYLQASLKRLIHYDSYTRTGTFRFYPICSMLLAGRTRQTGKPPSGSPCRRNTAADTDPDVAQYRNIHCVYSTIRNERVCFTDKPDSLNKKNEQTNISFSFILAGKMTFGYRVSSSVFAQQKGKKLRRIVFF